MPILRRSFISSVSPQRVLLLDSNDRCRRSPGMCWAFRRLPGAIFRSLARLPRRCRIVLDNYHEVPADAALHQLLACGVYELPDGVSVVVMSRQGPCAPMARLMAEQLMDTIGPDPPAILQA